jgi:DnaJ-class molecular chaperone
LLLLLLLVVLLLLLLLPKCRQSGQQVRNTSHHCSQTYSQGIRAAVQGKISDMQIGVTCMLCHGSCWFGGTVSLQAATGTAVVAKQQQSAAAIPHTQHHSHLQTLPALPRELLVLE